MCFFSFTQFSQFNYYCEYYVLLVIIYPHVSIHSRLQLNMYYMALKYMFCSNLMLGPFCHVGKSSAVIIRRIPSPWIHFDGIVMIAWYAMDMLFFDCSLHYRTRLFCWI